MSKQLQLTLEESTILKKLSNQQLQFFSKIKGDKDFQTLKDIVNLLIDIEKNIFFGEDGTKGDPMVLYAKHAYARGSIAGLVRLLHIIVGAEQELLIRENERKKGNNKD